VLVRENILAVDLIGLHGLVANKDFPIGKLLLFLRFLNSERNVSLSWDLLNLFFFELNVNLERRWLMFERYLAVYWGLLYKVNVNWS
jgi:hypothetical protein